MAVNKVVYGNDTLIDLTGDTVTPATMLNGTTAHDASGKPITGSYVPPATPTDITPSNSNPVALTADTPVNPTSGGYAIASYDNVTPSSTAVSVAADDIVKIGGAGVIVDTIPTPTNLTPSNSTPAQITSGNDYHATASGYAIQGYTDLNVPNYSVSFMDYRGIYKPRKDYAVINDREYKSVTPSNASPASMSTNNVYRPSASGYAIESYDSVTPSSTPEPVSSGDVVKIGGSGYIVDSVPIPTALVPDNSNPGRVLTGEVYSAVGDGYAVQTIESATPDNDPPLLNSGHIYKPTAGGYFIESYNNITPSNSTPVALTSGEIDKMGGNGYAIESYSDITPSNSTPVSLTSGSFYKPSASGYAISSYSSKTPSDTSPASVSSGAIIKASSAGYLYKTLQTKGVTLLGSVSVSNTSAHTVTLSASVKNYRYLLVAQGEYESGQTVTSTSAPSAMALIDSDNYVSGWTVGAGFAVGNSGSMTPRTATITYVSNTSIKVQQNSAVSRVYRFYGIN